MTMSEFEIIKNYCSGIGTQHSDTRLGVGDDAAIISVPNGYELAISVDTMVAGVHFLPDLSPQLLARKLLAVNLSDMAAMGASPRWATLALTMANADEAWLAAFSESLDSMAKEYGVELIGGDTTQGPLTLSLQIMGLVPSDRALKRSGAQVGDDLFVSNCLGDAALALRILRGELHCSDEQLAELRRGLDNPQPQVSLGQKLLGIATAAIDVSDGLVADLAHIAEASKVDIEVDVEQVPVSQTFVAAGGDMSDALYGGDDYQLLFTTPTDYRNQLLKIYSDTGGSLHKIGRVTKAGGAVFLRSADQAYPAARGFGFEHFSHTD
jgi:thiamine-monophosphate kinase